MPMETEPMQGLLDRHRAFYSSGATRSVKARLGLLARLKEAMKARENQILDALYTDLNKAEHEAYSTEVGFLYEDIKFVSKHLKQWTKPRRVKTALTHLGSKGYIVAEPYGTALIIAPWNYPLQLAISPLIGAVAAGNTAVVKPSELTPTVSSVIGELIRDVFPPDYVTVIEGGVDVSTALLKQPFDYIFFTGSVQVGKVVMEAAAKHLTPVTLELGGKSPCIVHRDADIALAARRIAFGKFTNAGQTCIAPDYLLVHREVKDPLVSALRSVIREFYGDDPKANSAYGKIVSQRHYERLVQFLHDGTAVIGGDSDASAHKISPTVLADVSWDMPVMREEIFGPILPLLEYESFDDVKQQVNARPKPLALYLFATDKSIQNDIVENISFGGGAINDTLMHIATPYLPFGGVGESGMGSYHGRSSFVTFSHEKSVLSQTNRFDLKFRYPGVKDGLKWIRKFMN